MTNLTKLNLPGAITMRPFAFGRMSRPYIYNARGEFLKNNELGDLGRADFAKAKEVREQKIEKGMKITEVADGGAAKKAGLRAGDIIVSVGTKRVRNLDELAAALAEVKGSVDAIVIRGETGKREAISIAPETGKIGVSVVPAELN